ncbi:PWWP-like protein [Cynara cardunculus var. scolymus]|uniref:PWWP-like protein n=1 Tax=Cynara cardunculus var. scolymus TaxID=59895 RepID=A0A103XW46_CYNCS|nr:PWWP-like protein [Cynara cardunculus var. scolymus]
MGSSFEANGKSIDPSVGGLVWVRRRNGSWWPGRILGPDELPESSLVSPRSGTPVKLLGREDARAKMGIKPTKSAKKIVQTGPDGLCDGGHVAWNVPQSPKMSRCYAMCSMRPRIGVPRMMVEGFRKRGWILDDVENLNLIIVDVLKTKPLLHSPRISSYGAWLRSKDWYNLEKSKRVKAFRCGEYDECIEKAKVSAAISCKKAVKYARREDAILHALELESSQISKDHPQMEKPGGKKPDVEESPICFHPEEETEGTSDKLSGLEYMSNSPPELSQGGALIDDSLQGGRRRTPNDSEDDGIEGSKKRMRGLEDIGVSGNSSFKRRRSQVAHVHEFLKKKNRRRQLTKVLESTAMVTVPVMCEQVTGVTGSFLPNGSDNKVSGLECNESKRSFSVVINNNSDSTGDASNNVFLTNCKQKENEISSISELAENDSIVRLFDVPFIGEEKQTAGMLAGVGAQSGQSSLIETVSAGHDEIQESGSISSGAAGISDISHRIDNKGTSKWQHKGKRNSRNKSKSKSKFLDTNVVDNDADVVPSRTDSMEQVVEGQTVEITAPQRLLPYRQSRFTVNPKYQSSDLSYRKHDIGSLYDVNIEVKTGHRPHHVPYISLMSKLTGQPITGHPIVVEVLDNGVSDLSLNGSECHSSSCELDGDVGWLQVQETRGSPGKSPKKPRRNGILSNKKIRRLSSLTGSKRLNETGKFKKPGLACVPLKVVFGRINAALGISSTRSENFGDAGDTR